MNEQIQNHSEKNLINLLFSEGLQNALPRIAEILINTANANPTSEPLHTSGVPTATATAMASNRGLFRPESPPSSSPSRK